MLYDLDKLVKCSTLAKNKGVSAPSMFEQLKGHGIEPIIVDGVKHYDLELLPEKIKSVKRKENGK